MSSLPPSTGFIDPDFLSPMDVAERLEAVPRSATCKGMFFSDLAMHSPRLTEPAHTELKERLNRRYLAFRDYPLRDHMELTAQLCPILHPGVPLREGLRRLGWLAWPTFANSLVGRVAIGLLGNEPERVLEITPRSISLSLSPGSARSWQVGEQHFRLELKNVYGYVDCFYIGAMEGALRHVGVDPMVRIQQTRICDAVFDITWR